MPLDPYFSAGKMTWLLERDPRRRPERSTRAPCVSAPSTPSCATGSVPGSPPIRPPRRGRSSAHPSSTRGCSSVSGCRPRPLPSIEDTAGDLGVLRQDSWPVELPLRARCLRQQAALAGAGCVEPGLVKATYGTGVFVLAHAGDGRPDAERRPAADRRLAGRGPGRVGARRGCLHRRGAARVAEPRPRLGRRPGGARGGRAAGGRRGRGAGAARRSPGWAPRGGGRTRAR